VCTRATCAGMLATKTLRVVAATINQVTRAATSQRPLRCPSSALATPASVERMATAVGAGRTLMAALLMGSTAPRVAVTSYCLRPLYPSSLLPAARPAAAGRALVLASGVATQGNHPGKPPRTDQARL